AQVFLELDRQPAVDDERVARDERRLVGAEEDDRVGDVHRLPGAAQRVLLVEELEALGVVAQRRAMRSVTMWPGQMQLTRMPTGPKSQAICFVRPMTADLPAS